MEWLLGAFGTLTGLSLSYLAFMMNRDKGMKKDITEQVIVSEKLNHISHGVDDIKVEVKASEKQMNRMNEQLIRVDESAKSAHKRIDSLVEVRKHG